MMEEVEINADNPYDWLELDGKVLVIKAKEIKDGFFVCGMDVNDPEQLYILHWDLPKEGTE